MPDLVNREQVYIKVCKGCTRQGEEPGICLSNEPCESLAVEFASAPEVDAVEVVRCRECIIPHNRYTGCPRLNGLITPPDFFCGFGEKQNENQRARNMRWNDDGSCPVCGEYDNRDPFGSKFCPNCGAKLDLEKDHGNQTDI